MKIKREKYPLVESKTRNDALSNEIFVKDLISKLEGDQNNFEPEYLKFIENIRQAEGMRSYLIAESVSEYLFDNNERLLPKMWGFLTELPKTYGCILWRDWTFFFNKFNSLYENQEAAVIQWLICSSPNGEQMTCELGSLLKKKDEEYVRTYSLDENSTASSKVGFTLSILFLPFLEFAECETKIVNLENRRAKLNGEKFISDIDSDIEIVDSNWFTTLIRSEGFKVNGHFRLQPYGTGRLKRKMIWISDFEKQGYTKRSKIEIRKEE